MMLQTCHSVVEYETNPTVYEVVEMSSTLNIYQNKLQQ